MMFYIWLPRQEDVIGYPGTLDYIIIEYLATLDIYSPLFLPDRPGDAVDAQVVEHAPVGAPGAHLVGPGRPQLTPV